MRLKNQILAVVLAACASPAVAQSANLIQDPTFLQSIGVGSSLTPWSDWTRAGITRSTAPAGITGNYAAVPVYGDLFQRFADLDAGDYTLTFYARNESAWDAKLVFAVQQALGSPINQVIDYGLGAEIALVANSSFQLQSLHFSIGSQPFPVNELYFSNSYNSPVPPIEDSINPRGTILDIADVQLTKDAATPSPAPEPTSWLMMLVGFGAIGRAVRASRLRNSLPHRV